MDTEKELSKYRISQAEQCLKDAKLLMENGGYKSAANRAYYCVFHSMRSLLALDRVDFKTHRGVIAYFREHYIKTGIFDVKLSDILSDLLQIRTDSDYDDHYEVTRDELEQRIGSAETFHNEVKVYLERTPADA